MSAWTKEEIEFLTKNIDGTPSQVHKLYSARKFSPRTPDAIGRQLRRLKAEKPITSVSYKEAQVTPERVMVNASDIEVLADALGRGKRLKTPSEHKEDKVNFEKFTDELINATVNHGSMPINVPTGGASLCILLSDTHIGKMTKHFNKQVFEERINSIADKMLSEITLPEQLDEVVIMLAGDMLEGEDIYQTQAHHLEMPVIDQVQIAVSAFWNLALRINDLLEVPVRFEVCPGNHGRVSKLASEKSNWDNVIYQTLHFIAQQSGGDISVNVNFESFHLFQVQDKTGMLFHHGTKHLGTAAMQTKVSGWLHTKKFDFMCHGHWHAWAVDTQFGKIVMKNGSLPGEDDLSERMGVWEPPRQGWLLIKHGMPINQFGFFEWENE